MNGNYDITSEAHVFSTNHQNFMSETNC